MRKTISLIVISLMICGCASIQENEEKENFHTLILNETEASLDGNKISEYDYTWHIDINNGEESHTGNKSNGETVYIDHDIVYFPVIDENKFIKKKYNGEKEWVYYYENEELKDFIFATLPCKGGMFPNYMMHSEEEANENKVLHINEAGTYKIEGSWHGQILVDLGSGAYSDESKKVTLILDGVDVSCDVGPSLYLRNVYEVDNKWKDKQAYTNDVDLTNAGAKIIINEGSVNNFTGANVFRLLKKENKNKKAQKTLYKIDGSFQSNMSLLIEGDGILNITSTSYEGLSSLLHLTINGGEINISSMDDGINANEDDVSVITINDGKLNINAGQGAEGDVIDSNGFIKINGGYIYGTSPSKEDYFLDTRCGHEISENATLICEGDVIDNTK